MTFQLPKETAQLKEGAGADIATARCRTCHSVDCISTQPSNKGKAFWDAEAQKMTNVCRASISPSMTSTRLWKSPSVGRCGCIWPTSISIARGCSGSW